MKRLLTAAALATAMIAGASAAQAAPGTPDLRRGNTGNGVRCIQWELNYHFGYKIVGVDGSYGPATESAVIKLQLEAGGGIGPVDGVVGPRTGQAIYNGLKIAERNGKGAAFSTWNCYWNLPTVY